MDFFTQLLFGPRDRDAFFRSRGIPEAQDETTYNSHGDITEDFSRKSFDVFTDPLQMHQYFERELDEILKRFGFQGLGEFSFGIPNVPVLEDPEPNKSQDVRDQFLKKGYDKLAPKTHEKVDRDLDDKIISGDLDSVLGKDFSQQITPYERPKIEKFFYGKSQSLKTITHPDGSIETQRTVRDNEGNEETSVCHRIGVKEYCVLRKKDRSGKEEVTEQFVNMDENERDIFTKPNRNNPINEGPVDSRFPFDKFFK